ncbi:MAG TPA: VOC family protein [Candidatus Saccharimonadales bacterium]|nr:VOC family protein [Candidatus Saccharimonadales bacterium]
MSASHPPAVFITGLFETHLRVKNLERSAEFYEKILGLELGMKEYKRRVAFYWIGGQGKTMLGLWENPPWVSERNTEDQIIIQLFAFEIAPADLGRAVAGIKERGIELRNFFEQTTDVPSVFGWVPAASIYFNDPDGHLLEFIAKLPGKAKPEIGVVSLDEWNRLNQSAN